jgi:MoxR-like ATPase
MEEEGKMLLRLQKSHPIDDLQAVAKADDILAAQAAIRDIHVDDKIRTYILQIVHGSREHEDVLLGGSPRASIALFRTSQALAAIGGREFVLPDDVKRMAQSVLAHRIILKPESRLRKRTTALAVQDIVSDTAVPVLKESYEGVRDHFA